MGKTLVAVFKLILKSDDRMGSYRVIVHKYRHDYDLPDRRRGTEPPRRLITATAAEPPKLTPRHHSVA